MTSTKTEIAAAPEETGIALMVGSSAIERAAPIAKKLKEIIEKQRLFTAVNGKKFTHVEGWTTLGAMVGVFADVIAVERIDNTPPKMIEGYLVEIQKFNRYTKQKEVIEKFVRPAFYSKATMTIIPDEQGKEMRTVEEIKYRAEVSLVTLNGQKFGKAFAICSNLEEGKLLNPEYSIASMAETRGTGKAFRLAFSWVMTMAEYEATPFEELGGVTLGGDGNAEAEKIEPAVSKAEPEKVDPAPVAKPAKAETAPPATPKAEFKIPAKVEDQKVLWSAMVKTAKKIGISIDVFLENQNCPKPPTASMLPKLLPALSEAIDKFAQHLERPEDAAIEV